MQTLMIIALVIAAGTLGSRKQTNIMSAKASATALSKILMAVLLIIFLIPLSSVITLSIIKTVSFPLILVTTMGAYTYGYLNEMVRLTTYTVNNGN